MSKAATAPAGTPREVVDKLNAAFTTALKSPEVQQRFALLMAEPVPTSPEQFGQTIVSEVARWTALARDRKIQLDE